MRKKYRLMILSVVLMLLMIAAGCSNSDKSAGNKEIPDHSATEVPDHSATETPKSVETPPNEPITISLKLGQAYIDVFQAFVEPVLKEKHPNITLEYVDVSAKVADLVTAGNIPDIIYQGGALNVQEVINFGLQYDLADLINKYNFNLTKISKELLDGIKAYSPNGELYGLPSDRSVEQGHL